MNSIDEWASFLMCEKLTPRRVADTMTLVRLAEELAKHESPKRRPYVARLKSRRLVCETAIDLGIDLGGIMYRGKLAMSRGLLDAWNLVYTERFGSNYGTLGWRESKRRNAKMNIGKSQ